MKEIKFIIKYLILPVCLIIFFNFLEYGFIWNKTYQFIQPLILTVFFIVNMQVPKLRCLSFALAYGMLALMVLLYLLDQLNLSNAIGSNGLAILIITVLTYLPQLIKEGHLKKF